MRFSKLMSVLIYLTAFLSGATDAQVVIQKIQPATASKTVATVATPVAAPVSYSPQVQTAGKVQNESVANSASAAAEKSPADKKVELLMKATFDRTTAGMLKVWNDKPQGEQKSVAANAEETQQRATVENAFKGFVVFQLDPEANLKAGEMVQVSSTEEPAIHYGNAKILSLDGNIASLRFVPKTKTPLETEKVDEKKPVAKNGDQKPAPVPQLDSQQSKVTDSADETSNDEGKVESTTIAKGQKKVQEIDKGNPSDKDNNVDNGSEKVVGNHAPELERPAYLKLRKGDIVELAAVKEIQKQKEKQDEASVKDDVDRFVRDVSIGDWEAVKTFLVELGADNGDKVYGHLLKSLASEPKKAGRQQPRRQGQLPIIPQLSPEDILMLCEASPKPIQLPEPKDADKPKAAVTAQSTGGKIELPPGVSVDQLPAEVQAQIKAQAAAGGAASATPAKNEARISNHIPAIAKLISNSIQNGHNFKGFFEKVKEGTAHFGGADAAKRLAAAELFLQCGLNNYIEEFLPNLEDDSTRNNLMALKIWSKYAFLKQREDEVAEWLGKAWSINQDILSIKDVPKTEKDLALENLIRLSSQVEKEIGVAWINSSFTEVPERGMTILTNLGTKSAEMAAKANQHPESKRLQLLRLQNEAVEKLIELSPEQAEQWVQTLTLLAQNWLREADISLKYSTQSRRGSNMRIDIYGNYYWQNQQSRQANSRQPRPMKVSDVLELVPSQSWQKLVGASLTTSFQKTTANLFLRVNEEDKAFPFIERIAETHPEIAKELVHEFLKIWTRNHDPNSTRRQQNPYIFVYGFDRKADAIPLTRSKQERNLQELSQWIDRIRKMEIGEVDEKLLANAFTTCHSSAEVFQIDRFRSVFGDLRALKPETIAAICEKMRANLSANWRDIRNQEAKQTNRREPEVQQEVLRGYEMAMKLTNEALAANPDNWKLHLVKAALMFDRNSYSQSVEKSSEFSDRRDEAFEQFALAAAKYAQEVPQLEKAKQTTEVYDLWFYAGLGACDLGKVTDKTVPDPKQYPLIRDAIEALPTVLAESHMAKFANNLFTRMSPIKPEIKFRYLKSGFEIVGEHPRAWNAKKLYDYYKDLVHEIKFSIVLDGDEAVGNDQPFGVYVNILHTREIERESGGFGKYVQNQNNMMYAYNYGRPTENYRDKFNDSVDQALGEHFEVMNVTFQSPDTMESRPAAQPGWRITPYAYILLKAKGPQIDRVAPLKIDLDFLDTSGYVVIPIESPALVVDCGTDAPAMRPVSDLKVTQTLDERQSDEGKLIVEISANAKGLVPELDQIIELERANFELVSVDDQGVSPTAFEKDTDDIQIISDRSWTVEYKASESASNVTQFAFSETSLEGATTTFQRYEDADLVESDKQVSLERRYAGNSWSFLYWLIPVIVLGLAVAAALVYATTRTPDIIVDRFSMPSDVNPFTVLTLLKDIQARNGITQEQGTELQSSINRIEEFYFGEKEEQTPEDLASVAQTWLRRAR